MPLFLEGVGVLLLPLIVYAIVYGMSTLAVVEYDVKIMLKLVNINKKQAILF